MNIASIGHVPWNKGKKMPPVSFEARKKISQALSGENSRFWQGGITPLNFQIRGLFEYKNWFTAIFKRDDYTCQGCGERGCYLNADHIKPFARYPELRFEITNGRTLCVPCHAITPTYKGRAINYI